MYKTLEYYTRQNVRIICAYFPNDFKANVLLPMQIITVFWSHTNKGKFNMYNLQDNIDLNIIRTI